MANNNTAFTLQGYSYADAKVEFNGIELAGVVSFEYAVTQTKTNNYGMGKYPVSRSENNIEYAGSMEMDYDTQTKLQDLSTDGLLTGVPAGSMVFSLSRSDGGKEIVTMNFFAFQGDGISGSQGDENLTYSIDVIFGTFVKQSF